MKINIPQFLGERNVLLLTHIDQTTRPFCLKFTSLKCLGFRILLVLTLQFCILSGTIGLPLFRGFCLGFFQAGSSLLNHPGSCLLSLLQYCLAVPLVLAIFSVQFQQLNEVLFNFLPVEYLLLVIIEIDFPIF